MSPETQSTGRRILPVALVLALLAIIPALSSDIPSTRPSRAVLATANFDLVGLAVRAEPAHQDVPRHTATVIHTRLASLGGEAGASVIPGLPGDYRVRGELVGPSLEAPLELKAALGSPLHIPPLALAGDHLVINLRVVDASLAGEPAVAEVIPDTCALSVLDQFLVSEVQVREMTYEEIASSGLTGNPDSYAYYNFTLALGTGSWRRDITFPVALPHVPDDLPLVGVPEPTIGTQVPIPDVMPLWLEEDGTGGTGLDLDLGSIRIPGLIVFPGRIALLNQFFEAIVIVANGAPENSPLVVHSLKARIELPQAPEPPLRLAGLQAGDEERELHDPGPDGTYGTADDQASLMPGRSGQASFLIEGLKEGLHTVGFKLQGVLEGLPSGPVTVRGQASGVVRVRDAAFAVAFTHPDVVRAGQEYELAVTLFNSGSRDILGAEAELSPDSIIGADFADPDADVRREFPTTLAPGESGTVTWRLVARVTGAVTASYITAQGASGTSLRLVTGVGDRNVPLSPDSLILPEPVRYLPPSIVRASEALLGQAWSIATAPSGSLPEGVRPVSRKAVSDRAVELGAAGLRVRFGEPLEVSLLTLLRDWLDENEETADPGFLDALCLGEAGSKWQEQVGEQLGSVLGAQPSNFHQAIVKGEMARSRFLSVLVGHGETAPFLNVQLLDPEGNAAGLTGEGRIASALRAALLPLKSGTHSRGIFVLASRPLPGFWTLELSARHSGPPVDISILLPIDDDLYRSLSFTNLSLSPGATYRVRFDPYSSSGGQVEQCAYGACSPFGPTAAVKLIDEPAPALTAAVQVGPALLESGDRFGCVAALLFTHPVSVKTAEDPDRYVIGGGEPIESSPVKGTRGPIHVTGAKLNFGNRFVFLRLSGPIGPFIHRNVRLEGVTDSRGLTFEPPVREAPIEIAVSPNGIPPGAFLGGQVLNADGVPVPGAEVNLWTTNCAGFPVRVARIGSNGDGRYAFDYVIQGECGGPVTIEAIHPVNRSAKRLTTPILYHGQQLKVDLVFPARGMVEGTVTLDGRPAADAQVRVLPNTEPSSAQLVRTDINGKYLALDIPVGDISVLAVGNPDAGQSNATGFGAGRISGPGATATVDIALQSLSGSIRGHVVDHEGRPVSGILLLADSCIPGICIPGATPRVSLGFCYTASDGGFELTNLPLTAVRVYATDYTSRSQISQEFALTSQNPSITGVILALPGYGSISGRVVDEAGRFVALAEVQCGLAVTKADPLGYYSLPMVSAGTQEVRATHPTSGMTGTAEVMVTPGEETTGADIVILSAARIQGTVSIVRTPGDPPEPLAGAKISDGRHIVQTNATGAYLLPNVKPGGPFILRVVDPTGRLAINQPVTLNPGETLLRNITFHPAAIAGKVFQPDGQTGAVARIEIRIAQPILAEDERFGILDDSRTITTWSAGDGSFVVSNLNPTSFRITAWNDFFPTPVSRLGVLAPNGLVISNLTLVDTLTGTIQGRVFRPDGVTPAGKGGEVTLSGGLLAEAMVRTDDEGRYRFPEVFASGIYTLTAVDPQTGQSNQVSISTEQNEDCITDIRLLGRGSIQVRVVDAASSPVESAVVTLKGVNYPYASARLELTEGSGGAALLEDLPEGEYAVTAAHQGLAGRVSAFIPLSGVVEVLVHLQPSGRVTGRVTMPDDAATPAGLADVRLIMAGKTVGLTLTSDEGDTAGTFAFDEVPLGDFKLQAFDNRSTRVGRTAGRITVHGETASADIVLLPIGTVRGRVTSNNAAVDHAYVTLEAGEVGFSRTKLHATTDADGNYRFPGVPAGPFAVSALDPASGQTGSVAGLLMGGVEPLPDKIVDIALESSAALEGVVLDTQGTPVAGAKVTVTVGARRLVTRSNSDGTFRFDYVTLGEAHVWAEAPSGYDRGRVGPVIITEPGATISVEVHFDGVGTIRGEALEADGVTPLQQGTVTFTNTEWPDPVKLACPVVDGSYRIENAPAGPFSLKLAVPGRTAAAGAAETLESGQVLTIPLILEPAGTVTGKVIRPDGTTPAVGTDVTVKVTRPVGGTLTLTTHTDAAGIYRLDQVILGMIEISVHLLETDGRAAITALHLSSNGQVLEAPLLVLDEEPIRVQSVSPTNGSVGVSRSTVVRVTFTEPADPSTVNTWSFSLFCGPSQVSGDVTLSPDSMIATLTPHAILPDNSIFTVVVSTQVRDLFGRNLPAEFRSTFATPDETPPVVTSVDPAAETTNVDVEKIIEVSFNEALDPEQAFAGVVRLFPDGHPEALVPLVITLSESGKTLIADPSVPLSESTRYRIEVTSQKDLAGNIQTALFSSRFSTIDRTKPVIDSVSVEGEMLLTATPLIVVYYHDDFSGIDPGSVILRLDGQDIRAGASVHTDQIRYQVPDLAPLGPGEHVLEIQVSDKAGNTSDLKSASFTIDNVPPEITSFTIAGWPATDGMMLTVFRPVFEASYSDNGAIDPARVILRLGREGEPLFEVPAAATSSGLTYQPSTDLQDGVYFVELVVVDLLGNSVSAGPIRFVIDVDAPQITLVAPISGTQHGGTVVVIEGARLLQPDGSWPLVTVGGSPAYVVSSQVGPPETVTIVTPPGAPGLAPIRVETERGVGTVSVFCYEPDRQTPFAVESDTLLLWHFDQPGDTYGMWEGQLVGSAPFFINAWTDADFSRPVPGRFGFGRTGNVWIEDDFGLLTFENRSFTVEFWMKTAPVDEPHVLVGNYEDNGTFAVLILPSGAIYGRVIDDSGLYWEVSTAAGIRADDGQWHQVTLVVDREGKMLRLYVDGLEQAAEPEPVGFGGLTDCYYLETGFGDRSYDPFPGVIDEVRISAGVKDAARVLEIFLGQEGPLPLEATYVTPVSLIRGREQEIRIYGYNLEHVQAEMRDEEGVSFPVQVASNSATEARILVDVPTHGESDLGRLFLRGHRGEVTREFRLIDPTRSAPQLEADTLVLWRLDEEQGITLGRDTASLIDPQMSPDACEGFFGRARSGSVTGTSTPLRLTDASFTLEAWVRLEPFSLIQIYGSSFLLSIADDSDGLVALLSGTKADLQAKAPLLLYSESGRGSVRPRVGTGWRHVAMTVDRQAGRLAVYLDGIEQAATDIPENFALREVESGLWIWSWGSTVVDEIRLSSTAHTPAKIWEDFSGSHSFDVTSILPFQVNQPRLINRGSSTRLEINGFELDGVRAELRRNGAVLDGTSISILESAYRRAVVELVLGPAVELGDADLVIIGPDDAAITCPVQIIDPQPLAVDPQTLLLWRLDEPGDGVTEIADAGPVRLRGSSGASSKAVEGRFAGGRFCANIAAVPDNGLLGFSETSFTVQAWFKGRRPNADGLLFGRSAYKTGWGLWLLANGRLRVDLWNQSGLQCQAEVPVLTDVASGFRKVDIADDLWHFLTLVVDREVSAIKIYADGILVLQAAIPADFGPLKTAADGVFRVGYTSYSDPGLPGVLDEVRIRHGASSDEQVWQEFSGIGSPRITGVFPSIINRDRISPASTTEVLVEGYNLSGVTGQIVRDGNVIPGTSVAVAEASDRFARLLIGLPSDVGLGAAQLRLHGGDETAEETLLIAERRPLSVEEDTVVLWHMDEPENGAIRVSDESDFAVSGTADPESEAIPGRFGLGRTRALIEADDDYGLLDFGSSSFTLQCWVRTEEIASNYILVGKSMPAGQAPKYWISLSRNNRIIASVRDTYFREWKAEAGPVFQDSAGNWTVKSVTDGQWHMITMVVDREAGVLRLYLDGSEAAASPIPDGFGPTRSGERLHAGNRDVYSGGGSAGPEEFPGVIDEIRVSSSAHSPEKVMADFLGHEQPEITKISPGWVPAGARGFPVTLHGTYLSEISIQSDSPFVQVDSFISGANKCDLWITISDLAPSCPARLTVTDSLGHSCHADLVITTAQPFPDASAAENDTLVLWRLDEPEDGAIEIQGYGDPIAIGQDYVPIPIQATSSPASVSAEGRFGRGRALADLVARSDFGSFEPGLSSFTLQCWFKTRPVGRTYMLVGRSGVDGHAHEFGIHLFPSGLLRAFLIDTAHNNWQVDVPARLYDASSSVWRTCVVDDEQWHLLTMVVDRASDQLMLYVDQELRASAPAPTGFGALRNSNLRFRAGLKNIWSGGIAAFPDADQFPGVLDEVRLISGVRTSEEIRADFGLPTSSPEDTTSFVGGQAVDKLNRDWALRPLRKAATAPFENIDQGDGETLLLWRLDERRNGAIRIAGAGDAVPEIIGGIASPASIAETGRFAGGRTNAGITADPDNSALDFGASSFTLEFWLRTDPVFATFTLAGRDGPLGESKDFGISLLPSGGLRAWLYDEAGLEWSAESEAPVDDSVWRLVTMSVDREAGWLYLLIDDEVVAASPCPDGFKGVRNQGQPFRAGHLDAFGPARFTAPAEFPGVLDEMRVLNYARKPGETK